MNKEFKKLLKGTLFSSLIPLIGISIFYFIRFTDYTFWEYIRLMDGQELMAPVISLSLIPNILLFFFFVNRNLYRQGQGVIFGMLLWGMVIIYFKFLD
ncbi:MAG: hypothetical protein ACPGLV_03220 [Bacteroidia bacterium]